ncbi:MAG: dynamin family protein [Pseudomonadota bacterium]|nr:dynamin family protein [Pseudomonadota bacterium]MDP2353323.1 dynamin family protein [Pseudomonadota bacterium]
MTLYKTKFLNGNSKVEKTRSIREVLGDKHPGIDSVLDKIFRIVEKPLTVAVMGEFSSGKSSFLNRLLHIDALPVSVLPKTATLTRLVYGTTPAVEIEYNFDGNRSVKRTEGYEAFKELQSASRIQDALFLQELERIHEVRVYVDNQKLKTFELLDTPGFNHDAAMDAKSLQALENTDLVIWISDYTQAAKKTEFEKLQYINERVGRLHLVINKGDVHVTDSESYHKAKQELSASLTENGFLDFFQSENVHLISCKPGMVQSITTEGTQALPPAPNWWSKVVAIVCSWFGKATENSHPSTTVNSTLSRDPFWDGIFEQFAGNFGASVLNADLALSVSLIDEQRKRLDQAIQDTIRSYRGNLDTVTAVKNWYNVDNLVNLNWDQLLNVAQNTSLHRVKSTLLEHCRSSGELCKSDILSASSLALEYTKAALYDDFCEFRNDYTKRLADLDKHYCSLLLADLNTIAESIPQQQQHQHLIETAGRLVDFYTLRADTRFSHDQCNLPATSRTLELLDYFGFRVWNQKANRFSIDWKQGFFATKFGSEKLVTDMSFDRYAQLQIDNSFRVDFVSDMCRLTSDPVVHDFIEEATLAFQSEISALTNALEMAK